MESTQTKKPKEKRTGNPSISLIAKKSSELYAKSTTKNKESWARCRKSAVEWFREQKSKSN